ncbi:notch-regulated ankyrin repeat-containing protein [Zootoca vivipara]|uniref:notch-regulated ankyrin repeat-containing protein n=1 Tax=Zootoca vivipara TaxID=8524 RepID=UPI00293BAD2D|nr:notch-regulated ankyrin repeat-containing protein [Zootoca vivipara]
MRASSATAASAAAPAMSQAELPPPRSPTTAPPSPPPPLPGERRFREAVRAGNTAAVHALLRGMSSCEFNVNSFGPEGQTALHQSVSDGNLELVKLLVRFGADVRLANRDGWSALHMAAFGGHQDIVLYLVAKARGGGGGAAGGGGR